MTATMLSGTLPNGAPADGRWEDDDSTGDRRWIPDELMSGTWTLDSTTGDLRWTRDENPAAAIPATGATAGTPGTWTPADSTPPATVAALQAGSITASPTSAWTEGQYVQTGTTGVAGRAYWDGDSWEPGATPAPEPEPE